MKRTLISLFIGIIFFQAHAQEIEDRLYTAGFENIQIKEKEDTLKVFFEHREFRSPYHSMQYADLLLPEIPGKELLWVPLHHNQPIGIFSADDYQFNGLSKDDRAFYKKTNDVYSGYRFHFVLQPVVQARFGFYSHPFETKVNLHLNSRVYLARGLSLQTGINIPVQNSLDNFDSRLRLAPTMLHYFGQPAQGHFTAVSLGTFHDRRYGLDIQYRYAPLDGRWSFGLESALTGYHWQNDSNFYLLDMNDLYAIADVEYRLPFGNLSTKLSAGQFLYTDKGIRLDLIKQYGTVDIGLFTSITEAGTTTGFNFTFSLFPGTIYRSRNIEVRSTEEFPWEYNYSSSEPAARSFRLGLPRLSSILRQYNALFMENLE